MTIDAPAYLAQLQKQESLHAALLDLVPPGGGGTDVRSVPEELARQFEAVGAPKGLSRPALVQWLFDKERTGGLPTYNALIRQLPPDQAAKLALGPCLAIGSRSSAELNGRTYRVPPPGTGMVILLDAGATLLTANVAAAVVASHPGEHRAILSTLLNAALGLPEEAALVQRRLEQLKATKPGSPLDCGLDLAVAIEAYRQLGVIEPPKLIGIHLIANGVMPLPGDSARVGHPFAAASDLSEVMLRFLLCHELGHLDDDPAKPYAQDVEFEADRRGLRLMAIAVRSNPMALAGCFAALTVLFAMLEALERGAMIQDDPHPPSRERLDRLRHTLIHEHAADPAVLDRFEPLYQKTMRLWNGGCNVMRSTGWNGENAFDLHLKSCVDKSNRAAWEDQIPRWFWLGSPRGLCRAAAETRMRLQATRDVATQSETVTRINRELELVEWVFEAIPRKAPEVGAHLLTAYDAARSQYQWSGRMTDPFGPLLRSGVELSDWAAAYRSSEQLLKASINREEEPRRFIAGVRGRYYHVRWKEAITLLAAASAGAIGVAASFSTGAVANDGLNRVAACLSLVSVLAALKNPAVRLSGDEGLVCISLSHSGPCGRHELVRKFCAELSIDEALAHLRAAAAIVSLKALGCIEEYGDDTLVLAQTLWIWRPDEPHARGVTARERSDLRVLFLAADPFKQNALSLDEEIRSLVASIRSSPHRNIALTSAWAVRPDDIQVQLLQHRPHVLHFSGHGSESSDLILVNDQGGPTAVTKEALQHLLSAIQDDVRLVVLNACHSIPLADALVEVVDCAVGMSAAIDDLHAIKFSAAFYRALGYGRSVKTAFDLGINALMYDSVAGAHIPRLCTKAGVDASSVFLVNADPIAFAG